MTRLGYFYMDGIVARDIPLGALACELTAVPVKNIRHDRTCEWIAIPTGEEHLAQCLFAACH
jgi:hypothetical protein